MIRLILFRILIAWWVIAFAVTWYFIVEWLICGDDADGANEMIKDIWVGRL